MRKSFSLIVLLMIIAATTKALQSKKVIQVSMPKSSKLTFRYKDSTYTDASIEIHSSLRKDSVINKEVFLQSGEILKYSMGYMKDGKPQLIQKSFIIPQTIDTLKFKIDSNSNIYLVGGVNFFIEDVLDMVVGDPFLFPASNMKFLNNPNGYTPPVSSLVLKRNNSAIDSIYKEGLCTKNEYDILYTIAKTDYYFRLLYWARKNNTFAAIEAEMLAFSNEKERIQKVKHTNFTSVFALYIGFLIAHDHLDTKDVRNMVNTIINLGWRKDITIEYLSNVLEDVKIETTASTGIYEDLKKYLQDEFPDKLKKITPFILPALKNTEKAILLTTSGKKISFKEFMAQNANKLILIDFWASWCIPCREEAPFFEKAKQEFLNKNVIFVSISLDEDDKTDDWKKALIVDGLAQATNHYRLLSPKTNPLFSDFKITQIPRYILINSKGQFVDPDFLKPSDSEFIETLRQMNEAHKN